MAENTRELVLDILLSLEREKEFSNRLIKAVLDKYDYLPGQEKAFIKRVTEGTIERRIELDYYLDRFSSVPVRKMKPLIRNLLRMSVYQILYMDAVPDSAVCNEACKLAGKRKFTNLKGFVNGVLRKIAGQKSSLPMPDPEKEPLLYASVKYSMPLWLTEFWSKEFGTAVTDKILDGLMKVHPVSLRFSSQLTEEEREKWVERIRETGAELTQSAYVPYVYSLKKAESIEYLPGYDEGIFTVQDVSSALAVCAAGLKPGDFVVDVCAAPGGKSILASEMAGRVLSRDVSERKAELIRENAERMGRDNITVEVFDGTVCDEHLTEQADAVLLDVPCSGLGIIGKKRDIKYNATPESLAEIVKLQRQIVDSSWKYVKKGGVLLYSTCTINPEENFGMVRYITENLPFKTESLVRYLPEALLRDREKFMEEAGDLSNLAEYTREDCMQLLPGYMESDGFFFARLVRVE